MPTPTDEQIVSASLTTIMGLCIGIEDAYDDTVKPSTNKETVHLTDAVLQILMQLSNHIKLLPVHTIADEDDEGYEEWENRQQPDFDPDFDPDDDDAPPITSHTAFRMIPTGDIGDDLRKILKGVQRISEPTPGCDCPSCREKRERKDEF